MRYAIGCSMIDPKMRHIEGIYINGKYGLDYICCDDTKDTSNSTVRVFDKPEHAIAYAKKLSKNYDYEFSSRAKSRHADRDEFRFYLVKVDSDKFPLKLIKQKLLAGKDGISWREFEFEKR